MSDTQLEGATALAEARSEGKKPKAAKKAVAKKAATKKTVAKKAPAKKTAVKKTAVRKSVESDLSSEPAPVRKASRKKAPKAEVEPVMETAPMPIIDVPAPPMEPAFSTPAAVPPAPPASPPVSVESSGSPTSAESPPNAAAPPYPSQRPGAPAAGPYGAPRPQNGQLSRKARRWEKFKRKKQLQREAAAAGGGGTWTPGEAAGTAPAAEAPTGDGPEPGPRPWQQDRFQKSPRPPKPEPVLGPPEDTAGLLEISPKGFGFLRLKEKNFAQSPTDTFVTPEMVRKYGLRDGVWIDGVVRRSHRGPQLTELKMVNGFAPDQYRQLPIFEELTAINPNKRYVLETDAKHHTTRLVDMVAPIGRGQRGLIVAAPRAGKTTFLEHMAQAILHNYESVKLIVLLVDERPEEVTELSRALPGAEIMACSNDQDPRAHIRMAELAIERAKRLVEAGEHVFMLMDSITRLARAFNNVIRGGGKAMSGGIDSRALEMPRKIFAAARNTREAGSLTIIATALIDTNQKGDDLIFQEFKGTGNMELVLDRKIAQQYIYPAVDIFKSGTRREELLLPPYQLEKINVIRRGLAGHKPAEAMERMLHFLDRFKSNAELLTNIATSKG